MVGRRKTHNYPHGKPRPLVLLEISVAVLCGLWVFLVPGHWPRAIGILAAFFVIVFIWGKLIRHYEATGLAVPIPTRPKFIVRFPAGLPLPMVGTRLAFFVIVAFMVVFGYAPVGDSIANTGIISCIFALIGVAVLNVALERYYVHVGRATETEERTGHAPREVDGITEK